MEIERLNSEIRRLEEDRHNETQKFYTLQKQYSELEYQVNKVAILERENT